MASSASNASTVSATSPKRSPSLRVGELAESESHPPSLLTEWGRVRVTWYTTKIKDLHRNDFVMAAKTDRL